MPLRPRLCRAPHFVAAMAVLVVLALLVGVVPAAAAAASPSDEVEADPAVVEARRRAAEAAGARDGVATRLDTAAREFEDARAHEERLIDELADAPEVAARAQASVLDAEEALRVAAVEAWKHPGRSPALAGAVLVSPDAATALHRAALLERVVVGGSAERDRAARRGALVVDEIRQTQVVRAGAAGAAADRAAAAEQLAVALEAARSAVVVADEAVEGAVEDAGARAEQRRRDAELAAAAAAASTSALAAASGPPPAVDGKVCPIGAPNGFIDSWGFPRSGGRSHQGADMFAAFGMPLYAIAGGSVRVTSGGLGGLAVHLTDDAGDRYYYAHLSTVTVTTGQRVEVGQVLGANGDSGNARGTPAHLHFEFHPGGGAAVNPYPLASALCRPTWAGY